MVPSKFIDDRDVKSRLRLAGKGDGKGDGEDNSYEFAERSKCDCVGFSEVALRVPFMNDFNLMFPDKNDEIPAMTGTVLEVSEANPLEVSNLTVESKLLQALNDRKANKDAPSAGPTALQLQDDCHFPRHETPKKDRTMLPKLGTPDTLPMDDDDNISHYSKFLWHSESEVTIRVDDYETAALFKLVRTLRGNPALAAIEVYRLSDLANQQSRPNEEMIHFFAAIRSLPNLKKLILNGFSVEDIYLISFLVKNHATLEKIHVNFVCGTVDPNFLNILSNVPNLKEVSIDVQASFPVDRLLSSSSIQRIAVPSESFKFEEKHFVALMNALQRNCCIRILDLKTRLAPSNIKLLSSSIRDNTYLRILRFSFLADACEAAPALVDLCEALARNTTLRTVENYYAELLHVTAGDCYHMLRTLDCNDALKTLTLFNDDIAEQEIKDDVPSAWENSFLARLMCDTDNLLSRTAYRWLRVWDDDILCASCRTSEASESVDTTPSVFEVPNSVRKSVAGWFGLMKQ